MTPPIRPNVREPARGGFFQIDRRTWARATELGMNPAVAYLVLARGSGADNRTTAWSVQAVEKYTGISRGRARKAVKTLIEAGVVRVLRGGSKPKYQLTPWSDLAGHKAPVRKPMSDRQQAVYELVANGEQPTGPQRQTALNLTNKGWLAKDSNGVFHACDETVKSEADWIWLPNELVTGVADETPPVELIRQTQDVMTLRLLVDFYHAQNLREDGGISRKFTYQSYERIKVGQQAQYIVWGFRYDSGWVTWAGPTACHRREKLTDQEKAEGKYPGVDFFRREQQLSDLGLIEWVPYLFDGGSDDAEPIHPCGIDMGDTMEGRLCRAADEAGRTLITDRQREWASENGLWLAPVPRHMTNVQVIGVARLRYRPKTKLTAAWWGDLQAKGERYIQRYAEITAGKLQKAAGF